MRLEGGMVSRQVHLRPGELDLFHSHIPRQIDQHRTRSSCAGNIESLTEDASYILSTSEQVIVLGNGQSDPGYIRLLEGIFSNQPGVDLPGDGNHGHRVHVGVGNAGDKVRRPRPGGGNADTYLARGSGISIRHVRCSLLMAHQNMAKIGLINGII